MSRRPLAAVAIGCLAAAGCAGILGAEYDEAIVAADGGPAEASVTAEGGQATPAPPPRTIDASEQASIDASMNEDAGAVPDAQADACVTNCGPPLCPTDPSAICAAKCGVQPNGCGGFVNCGAAEPAATTCKGKCGVSIANNCGDLVSCTCPGAQVCAEGGCCTPEPDSTTCAGAACGTKKNNCGQTVTCPNTCSSPQLCGAGNGGPNQCCVPLNECNTQCGGTVDDGCGGTLPCLDRCPLACPCGGACSLDGRVCDCLTCP